MKYTQGRYVIVDKKAIAKGVFDFTISCKEIADVAECGQFVHIAADGFSLRRPISICDIDKEKGALMEEVNELSASIIKTESEIEILKDKMDQLDASI